MLCEHTHCLRVAQATKTPAQCKLIIPLCKICKNNPTIGIASVKTNDVNLFWETLWICRDCLDKQNIIDYIKLELTQLGQLIQEEDDILAFHLWLEETDVE